MHRTTKWMSVVGAVGLVGCGGSGSGGDVESTGGADTHAPAVQLVASSLHVTQAGPLGLAASASDTVGVSRVEFYDGPTKVGEDSEAPYALELPLTHAHNGVHAYTARARDAAGNEATSAAVNVQVDVDGVGPAVSLTASSTQVTRAGQLTLSANASDAVGVARVEFYDGAQLLDSDADAPFSVQVEVTRALNGSHSFHARAVDAAGNAVSSEPVAVQVAVPWTLQVGAADDDGVEHVATDAAGNLYVVGYSYGQLAGSSLGGSDGFLLKYAADGTLLWARPVGTDREDNTSDVAVGADGHVYVAGNTYGTFAGQTRHGDWDVFVAKYTPDGELEWARQAGTPDYEYAAGVAVDAQGRVTVVANTYGALEGHTNLGGSDFFVAHFAADGSADWATQLGTAQYDNASDVAVDVDGNVYVAGHAYGQLGTDTVSGGYDVVLLKLAAATGERVWLRQTGSNTDDYVASVALDAQGNVFVAGTTYGALEGDSSHGSADLFLMRFNASGSRAWTRQLGSSEYEWADELALDAEGNAYIAAYTEGALDGAADPFGDAALLSLTADGAPRWTRQVHSPGNDWSAGVAVYGSSVYLAGGTEGQMDGLPSHGGEDGFLVRYGTDGVKQ